jgi:hypothetical protein
MRLHILDALRHVPIAALRRYARWLGLESEEDRRRLELRIARAVKKPKRRKKKASKKAA